ncbi:MAG: sensor histidine kinase [Anaerolineae bacterium]|nr:sensor histidine kinase [Anaerolineae bacterium]
MINHNSDVHPRRLNFSHWLWVWHILMYIGLGISVYYGLVLRPHLGLDRLQILIFSLLLAVWYAIYIILNHAFFERKSPLLLVYFAVGWFIWFRLAQLEIMYLLLLVGLYPQIYSLPSLRWKIIGGVVLTALATRLQIVEVGYLPWWYFIIIGMTTIASILLAVFIHAIIDQNQERQRLIEELQDARDHLARTERQAGILEERQRLAHEIHDTLAQGFTSIIMHLETIEAVLGSDLAAAQKHIERARIAARESLADARRMVWALQPESLERASLVEAIGRLIDRWSEESSIRAGVTITGLAHPLPPEIEVTLLRAAQEALANIRKHAQAHEVTLTLSYMDDLVALDVHDDGQGFAPELAQAQPNDGHTGGFGLRSMRERVEALGGTFSVESASGEGATVAISLPVFSDASQEPGQIVVLQEDGQ